MNFMDEGKADELRAEARRESEFNSRMIGHSNRNDPDSPLWDLAEQACANGEGDDE